MDVLWPLSAAHSRAAQRSARPPRPPSFLPARRSDSQQTFVIWLQEVGAARGFCSQSCWLSTARTDGGNVTALPCTHTHTHRVSPVLCPPLPAEQGTCVQGAVCVCMRVPVLSASTWLRVQKVCTCVCVQPAVCVHSHAQLLARENMHTCAAYGKGMHTRVHSVSSESAHSSSLVLECMQVGTAPVCCVCAVCAGRSGVAHMCRNVALCAMGVQAGVRAHVCVCVCVRVCCRSNHACTPACYSTRVCTHTYTHTCSHTCSQTHTHMCSHTRAHTGGGGQPGLCPSLGFSRGSPRAIGG